MKTINKNSLIIFIIIYSLFISCRPEQKTTDFNTLVEAPSGRDMALETDEEEEILIEYSVEALEESIDLKLLILEQPKHGILKDCNKVSPLSISCIYIPDRNFNGVDSISFMTKDGDIVGEVASTIDIQVNGVPDAPIALDGSFKAKSSKKEQFKFPNPIDPDGVGHDVEFEIVSEPKHGKISKCHSNKCFYTSDSLFEGRDSITYQVIDHTSLTSNIAVINIEVSLKKNRGIETFTQGISNLSGVDIIWAIDNSGSMKDEQETLARNFQSFINNFMDQGKAKFPFNMGVITTDTYSNPKKNLLESDKYGVPYNLSSTLAENDFLNFKSIFEKAVNVGIDGSSNEKVFESMEKLQIKNSSWFGGNDKMLVYILMTDEIEQSKKSVEEWAKYFLSLKNEDYKVKIYPIVRLADDSDNRFREIAKLTGTKMYDIDSSFQEILDNISLSVSQNLSTFELKSDINIIPNSIKISVDGKSISAFKLVKNIIHLEQAPAAYSTITVTYNYGG